MSGLGAHGQSGGGTSESSGEREQPMTRGALVVCPLSVEALAVRSTGSGLRVHTTGMGPRKALAAVPALSQDPATALLIVGFGGGLSAESRLGEVVVADEVVAIDAEGVPEGGRIPCAGGARLREALATHGLSSCGGAVASVQEIVTGQARGRMLASGAVAVDMESAWIAQAARERPFGVIRVLSDTPEQELRQRLPVGPPLPTLANAVRAVSALRRVALALAAMGRRGELHNVLGVSDGSERQA